MHSICTTNQRPENSWKLVRRPIISWPTKFGPNLISSLSANVWKLLNQRPGNKGNSVELDQKLIRPRKGYNVHIQQIWNQPSFSGNADSQRWSYGWSNGQAHSLHWRGMKSIISPYPYINHTSMCNDHWNDGRLERIHTLSILKESRHVIFTRGQFWPSCIVVACVCVCVCLCVCPSNPSLSVP